jgi:hypothetical protein
MTTTNTIQENEASAQEVDNFLENAMNCFQRLMDVIEENKRLKQHIAEQDKKIAERDEKIAAQKEEIATLKEEKASSDMKLSEMTKLSADMAKKSSQEGLQKALTITINKSIHKRLEKRTAVKEFVMELALANGIIFPEDVAAKLDSLDDETEPPAPVSNSVTVQPGGLNVLQANHVGK